MKILYLFAVYKNPEIVAKVVEALSDEDASFMIHVDKSSKADFSGLLKFSNVHFATERYVTTWGGGSYLM